METLPRLEISQNKAFSFVPTFGIYFLSLLIPLSNLSLAGTRPPPPLSTQVLTSMDLTCRAKAKDIAIEFYGNCLDEGKRTALDQLKSEYKEDLELLKQKYDQKLRSLSEPTAEELRQSRKSGASPASRAETDSSTVTEENDTNINPNSKGALPKELTPLELPAILENKSRRSADSSTADLSNEKAESISQQGEPQQLENSAKQDSELSSEINSEFKIVLKPDPKAKKKSIANLKKSNNKKDSRNETLGSSTSNVLNDSKAKTKIRKSGLDKETGPATKVARRPNAINNNYLTEKKSEKSEKSENIALKLPAKKTNSAKTSEESIIKSITNPISSDMTTVLVAPSNVMSPSLNANEEISVPETFQEIEIKKN